MVKERISITVDTELVVFLDEMRKAKQHNFRNRSHVAEFLINKEKESISI